MEVSFAMSNAKVFLLLRKNVQHQWVIQYIGENDLKVMPSDMKLLYQNKIKTLL